MQNLVEIILFSATTIYQLVASWIEDRQPPPGKLIDVGGYRLHLYVLGEKSPRPTIVLEPSLGGIEGYLLIPELAKLGRVCIYDRAGYGWSDRSPHPRTSEQIVTELDTLLSKAEIEPPYILIGDSFGSYNVRLYAHRFPEKVVGMVLTDGLHETAMLKMSMQLRALQWFFISGFFMSIIGAMLGIIRLLNTCQMFELLKPELKQFPQPNLKWVKRSFCRPKHWLTMSQEMLNLDTSARQVRSATQFGALPIVSIKANSFFLPSLWTMAIPLQKANQLRDRMHKELLKLSTECIQMQANKSGHFVWIDRPDTIINSIKILLEVR